MFFFYFILGERKEKKKSHRKYLCTAVYKKKEKVRVHTRCLFGADEIDYFVFNPVRVIYESSCDSRLHNREYSVISG